jgi:hypothetical protein
MIWAGMSFASSSQIDQDIADLVDDCDAASFDKCGRIHFDDNGRTRNDIPLSQL